MKNMMKKKIWIFFDAWDKIEPLLIKYIKTDKESLLTKIKKNLHADYIHQSDAPGSIFFTSLSETKIEPIFPCFKATSNLDSDSLSAAR